MNGTSKHRILEKSVKNVVIDVHRIETAIVICYEVNVVIVGDKSTAKSKSCRKIIRLNDLTTSVDLNVLARYVIQQCPIIAENRLVELEQILYYLQRRKDQLQLRDATSSNDVNFTNVSKANIARIDDYTDMLYDDITEMGEGTALILELSKSNANIPKLLKNEVLIGAMARIFCDDWKKSFDLAMNIVSTFLNFSSYIHFHSLLARYKVGTVCLQVVEHELKRWEMWKAEQLSCGNKSEQRKWSIAIRRQQVFISACLNLLINMAVDLRVEKKLVNRNIVPILIKCLRDCEASVELLLASVNFLLKLSIFIENTQTMKTCRLVEDLAKLFPITDFILRRNVIRLMFNLSFDESFRDNMVAVGIVAHITFIFEDMDPPDEACLNLLYQLSINDDAKAQIALSNLVQGLKRNVLTKTASDVMKAILVNVALEKHAAQLICGCKEDGEGVDDLMEVAYQEEDQVVLKILRNIAMHNAPWQSMFSKWARRLLKSALNLTEMDDTDSRRYWFNLECLGIVNQLNNVDWYTLSNEMSLIDWITKKLNREMKRCCKDDSALRTIILCGTMARQLEAARLLIPLTDCFIELLSLKQEDDEMVAQIVYIFYSIITHEELSESFMGGSAQVGAYLLDLMHDSNAPIRVICDRALSIIAERSEEWARKMNVERFRWHNAQWLEMISENNSVVMGDSGVSDSSDHFADIFGAEELFGNLALNDFSGQPEYDF